MSGDPKPAVVVRKCVDCGNVQRVRSAASRWNDDGTAAYYFGSAYDFCNKCDGSMETVADTKGHDEQTHGNPAAAQGSDPRPQ
jgi:hypothetical protein